MDFNFFGINFSTKKEKSKDNLNPSPVAPMLDGSTTIIQHGGFDEYAGSDAGGCYGYTLDLDGAVRNESQQIARYRDVAAYPDCDTAIEQIVNEAVILDTKPPISLNIESVPEEFADLKPIMQKGFDKVCDILNFTQNCHDIFKRWYIDGRLYYYIIYDSENPQKGIVDLKYIDPRKIRKVVEYFKDEDEDGIEYVVDKKEYFIFNDDGLDGSATGIQLSVNSVIFVKSGLVDANTGEVVSHLFKAIKPVNQLKMMEDALVIYRIARAPERRVFYVDVGNMPGPKAEQYVNQIMNRFKNKIVYDADSGEVKNNRNYLSMMEDFWLPRREGGKATEIQTLPGGNSLGDLEDVQYFQKKLYQSLNVPRQRLDPENSYTFGSTNNITREEVLFSKFIQQLRNRFAELFREAIKTELLLTGLITIDQWDRIRTHVFFEFETDNYFEQMKRAETLGEMITQLGNADGYKGTYFSKKWIAKNIMNFSDDEWEEIQQQIKVEKAEGDDDFM